MAEGRVIAVVPPSAVLLYPVEVRLIDSSPPDLLRWNLRARQFMRGKL